MLFQFKNKNKSKILRIETFVPYPDKSLLSTFNISDLKFLIQKYVKKSENEYIEFKRENIRPKDIAETVGGFVNGESGVIIFGIDKNSEKPWIGINSIDQLTTSLSDNFSKMIKPMVDVRFEIIDIDGKSYVFLFVPKGKETVLVGGRYQIRQHGRTTYIDDNNAIQNHKRNRQNGNYGFIVIEQLRYALLSFKLEKFYNEPNIYKNLNPLEFPEDNLIEITNTIIGKINSIVITQNQNKYNNLFDTYQRSTKRYFILCSFFIIPISIGITLLYSSLSNSTNLIKILDPIFSFAFLLFFAGSFYFIFPDIRGKVPKIESSTVNLNRIIIPNPHQINAAISSGDYALALNTLLKYVWDVKYFLIYSILYDDFNTRNSVHNKNAIFNYDPYFPIKKFQEWSREVGLILDITFIEKENKKIQVFDLWLSMRESELEKLQMINSLYKITPEDTMQMIYECENNYKKLMRYDLFYYLFRLEILLKKLSDVNDPLDNANILIF